MGKECEVDDTGSEDPATDEPQLVLITDADIKKPKVDDLHR